MAEISRRHKLNQQMVSRWKTEFLQNAPSIFERKKGYNEEQQRIADLERILSRKTMELEIAKKAYSILEQMEVENGRILRYWQKIIPSRPVARFWTFPVIRFTTL